MRLSLDTVLAHSPDVAARLVGGRVVLAPLHAAPGTDLDDLFSLSASGQAVWEALDGRKPLRDVLQVVGQRFSMSPDVIQDDVFDFASDLLEKRMVDIVSAV